MACFDLATGQPIADYEKLAGELKQAEAKALEAKAEAEREARLALGARLEAMEARLKTRHSKGNGSH